MPTYFTTRSFRYARDPRWASIRAKVLKRDDYLCRYCSDWAQCVDHVLPHSYGGTDDMSNLVSAYRFCNSKVSDLVFDSFEAKKEYLSQFFAEKVRRMRRAICICPDCGELFEWRKNGATAVVCAMCAARDDEKPIPVRLLRELRGRYAT